MKKIKIIVSCTSLLVVVAAPLLFYAGAISLDITKITLNAATGVWFISALFGNPREIPEEG